MGLIAKGFVTIALLVALVGGFVYLEGGKQTEYRGEVDIDASAEVVMKAISTPGELVQWIEGASSEHPDSNRGYAFDLTLAHDGNRHKVHYEWAEGQFVENDSLVYEVSSDMYDAIVAFRIEPFGEGVKLRQLFVVTHKDEYRLTAPFVRSQYQAQMTSDLNRLKRHLEQN